jgi:hypothetical protein
MARQNRSLKHTRRAAAIHVSLCVATVLGISCLLLQSTVWNTPAAAPEPFYTSLPDVDLKAAPPAKAEALVNEWNVRRCPCDCMRTVASCRNHHRSCTFSLRIARAGIAAAGAENGAAVQH